MRTAWWIATALVLVVTVGASIIFSRRGAIAAAQAAAIAFLGYALVFTALWGMASHFIRYPEVDVPRPAKRILLAMAGGLLAQLLIILDSFLRGVLSKNRVAPLYARGAIGALAGVVGLLIAAAPFSGVEKVDDSLAILCGVAGGGLGASVLELARTRYSETKKNRAE
jgi:hypothetical protein